MSMNDDIKNILVSEEALKAKVAELGAQIWTATFPARTC